MIATGVVLIATACTLVCGIAACLPISVTLRMGIRK